MTAKFLLVSILDLLLGLNFLSPTVLVPDSSIQNSPYLSPAAETNYFPIRDWGISDLEIAARSAILYDSASEKVLFDKNSQAKLAIASLTKLMTAVLIIENMDLGDVVAIKKSTIEKSEKEGGGNDLYEGEKIKAADLFKLMLIESSNVAAYAFADHLEEKYAVNLVEKMNEKARLLGMNDTFFTEAAGLDDQKSFSTGQDLVKLIKYSFRYAELYDILKIKKAEVASIDGKLKHQVFNTNELLGKLFNIIGGKTGFTELSGGSMILVTQSPRSAGQSGTLSVPPNNSSPATLSSGASRLIAVVLGSNDRFTDAEALVNWATKAYLWK
ncbi:MAG: D-alanyl-D-alanine carboxypeptidase [Parcubacteria group bacterium]|nr:D-alanyl-D-alanine carboxypeptidase [Parcubacteria group bacterium]